MQGDKKKKDVPFTQKKPLIQNNQQDKGNVNQQSRGQGNRGPKPTNQTQQQQQQPKGQQNPRRRRNYDSEQSLPAQKYEVAPKLAQQQPKPQPQQQQQPKEEEKVVAPKQIQKKEEKQEKLQQNKNNAAAGLQKNQSKSQKGRRVMKYVEVVKKPEQEQATPAASDVNAQKSVVSEEPKKQVPETKKEEDLKVEPKKEEKPRNFRKNQQDAEGDEYHHQRRGRGRRQARYIEKPASSETETQTAPPATATSDVNAQKSQESATVSTQTATFELPKPALTQTSLEKPETLQESEQGEQVFEQSEDDQQSQFEEQPRMMNPMPSMPYPGMQSFEQPPFPMFPPSPYYPHAPMNMGMNMNMFSPPHGYPQHASYGVPAPQVSTMMPPYGFNPHYTPAYTGRGFAPYPNNGPSPTKNPMNSFTGTK